jgi:hypothetical protein
MGFLQQKQHSGLKSPVRPSAEAFGPAWFETGSISVHFVNMAPLAAAGWVISWSRGWWFGVPRDSLLVDFGIVATEQVAVCVDMEVSYGFLSQAGYPKSSKSLHRPWLIYMTLYWKPWCDLGIPDLRAPFWYTLRSSCSSWKVGHLQPVRAFLEISGTKQRKVWMEHLDGVATQHRGGTPDFGGTYPM